MVVFQFLSNENVTGPTRKVGEGEGGFEGECRGKKWDRPPTFSSSTSSSHPLSAAEELTDVMSGQSESFVSVNLQYLVYSPRRPGDVEVCHSLMNLEYMQLCVTEVMTWPP